MHIVPRKIVPIDKNWVFRQADDQDADFLPVSQFPTNIHLDLIHHNIIQDPFIGKNEQSVQWVGEKPWIYKTQFLSPSAVANKAVLVFDGLDTFATVRLNGRVILSSENMFVPERVEVTEVLNIEGENTLEIVFKSAWKIGKTLQELYPEHRWGCWNGDPSRCAVRKAQYHYGWDWGPKFLTCGPWRPIRLEIFTSRIADFYFHTDLDDRLERATFAATVEVEGEGDEVSVLVFLHGEAIAKATAAVNLGIATVKLPIREPQLWYPRGYGEQPLYTVQATLFKGDSELDKYSKRFGIRKARVIQRPLENEQGTTFFFEINNIPIFCGGSNWIPADSFIPRLSREKYRDWLELVAKGNQLMLRVWGGGIYEEAVFYETCDELGLLVWQDFMFACGNYPAHANFLENVEREAIANVKRLRDHPSIVIWAGNNEDYQYAESEKLEYNPNDQDPENWLKSTFPARYIYEKLLPDVIKKYNSETHYHFGSPWGGKTSSDPTVGDIHQWNVWHGTQEKYQNFGKLSGRFVSEFGMEGFPNIETIDSFLPSGKKDTDRYPQSYTVDFHNKAVGHERRLAAYMIENIRHQFQPFEQYIHCTQVMQAECLATAYRLWRRQWKGPGKEYCAGTLVWQMNDCWPVTSWSIVDYYLRPKHAYFAIKRELAPVTVNVDRSFQDAYVNNVITVWASNSTLERKMVEVKVEAYDIVTGDLVGKAINTRFTLEPNRSTEIRVPFNFSRSFDTWEQVNFNIVFVALLFEQNSSDVLARSYNWPEPLKYVHLQRPKELRVSLSDDARHVDVSTDVPVKGLGLYASLEGVVFKDNCIDICPQEARSVPVTGLKKGQGDAIFTRLLL